MSRLQKPTDSPTMARQRHGTAYQQAKRRIRRPFILLPLLILLGGCSSFRVINTDGLRLAYEDVDRATSKAVELRSLSGVAKNKEAEAVDAYREAKASINSYLQQAITDAADGKVDNPARSYTETSSPGKIAVFVGKVDEVKAVGQESALDTGQESALDWAPLAVTLISEIKSLNDEERTAAYERFKATVSSHMMPNFEALPGHD